MIHRIYCFLYIYIYISIRVICRKTRLNICMTLTIILFLNYLNGSITKQLKVWLLKVFWNREPCQSKCRWYLIGFPAHQSPCKSSRLLLKEIICTHSVLFRIDDPFQKEAKQSDKVAFSENTYNLFRYWSRGNLFSYIATACCCLL